MAPSLKTPEIYRVDDSVSKLMKAFHVFQEQPKFNLTLENVLQRYQSRIKGENSFHECQTGARHFWMYLM